MLYLNLDTICKFAKATIDSRNMREGQKCINSGMIFLCGASAKTNDSIELYALHLQSVLSLKPHTVTGKLQIKRSNNNNEDAFEADCNVQIQSMSCSCKAGTSEQCKHIVSILLYCNRYDIDKLRLISSTEMECLWKNHKEPVLEQFQARPTRTFCCINQNRLTTLPKEMKDNIRNRLIECHAGTALAKHCNRNKDNSRNGSENSMIHNLYVEKTKSSRAPLKEIHNNLNLNTHGSVLTQPSVEDYTQCIINHSAQSEALQFLRAVKFNLSDCCQNIYNQNIICSDALKIAIETRNCNAKWKKERKFRITGSRCYSLHTYSKNDWSQKSLKYFWPKEFSNKYVKHGNRYESVARIEYARQNNVFVQECGLVVSTNEPWLAYSPDGVVIQDNKLLRLLEIKCPFELENVSNVILKKKCNRFLKVEGTDVTLRRKHEYFAQVQCGMAILNLKDCDFVIYSSVSNEIKVINISYDKEYVEDLFSNLKERYFKDMLHEICKNTRVL